MRSETAPKTPKAIYLKDYRPTPYLIERVHLTFALDARETRVKAQLHMRPNPKAKVKAAPLELDGEKIRLVRHPNNLGAAAARNLGLRSSRGRYVALLDRAAGTVTFPYTFGEAIEARRSAWWTLTAWITAVQKNRNWRLSCGVLPGFIRF